MEVKITKDNFKEYVSGGLPLVVDFWATWCGPCRMMSPIVEELAGEYDGKVVIGKCNVDEERELAMEFDIRSIPTILYFKDGKIVEKTVGAMPKSELKAKIDAL